MYTRNTFQDAYSTPIKGDLKINLHTDGIHETEVYTYATQGI